MASLEELLLGGYGNASAQFQSQNPFYQAGQAAMGMDIAPRTSSEAIWAPLLKGFVGGALTGYGKKDAARTAFDAYKSNNLLSALNPLGAGVQGPLTAEQSMHDYTGDMPQGWTADIGKADLIQALQAKDLAQEEEKKKQALRDKIAETAYTEMIKDDPTKAGEILNSLGSPVAAVLKTSDEVPVSPEFEQIKKVVPKAQRDDALKETGTQTTVNRVFNSIDDLLDNGVKLAKEATSNLPSTVLGVPIPQSESKIKRDTLAGQIASMIIPIWKGPLDEKDAKRILDPFLPSYYDNESTIAEKKKGLKNLILNNSKETPILDAFGLSKKPTMEVINNKTPSGLPEGAQATGRTIGGKPAYLVNGRYWTPD